MPGGRKMDRKQIIMGGLGGQGIILSGIVLAEAAVNDGKFAVQTQNYGPESRGGASRADVIIADGEIFYPKVVCADIFLALSQEAFEKYLKFTDENTIIIVDENIDTKDRADCKKYDIIKCAYDEIKKPFTVNMIALGIINGLTDIASGESMKRAIEKKVPKGTFDINYNAYEKGYNKSKNR
jgi:2-oxoglutarate ferredoxin oxidoreductase subunit gamma